MQMRLISGVALMCGVVLAAGATGCSGSSVYNGHEYIVDASGFDLGADSGDGSGSDRAQLIDVVRGVLSDHRFVIDRVDARRGVVTTEFKSTQGIVSPWDTEQGSVRQELADFVNQHERAVRVDILDDGSVAVSVLVQRIHRPGWRIENESIAHSSRATVIGSDGSRVPGSMATPVGLDERLAQRIGEEISRRLSISG